MNKNNKLELQKIDEKEARVKPLKILNKTVLKKKIQINSFGGRNVLLEKNSYAVGDTLVFEMPEQRIIEHIPLAKGNIVYLIKGSHVGENGKIEEIEGMHISIKIGDRIIKTLKKYAVAIGKEKPIIKLIE